MLHSDPTPTFSLSTLSNYTPSYDTLSTWDTPPPSPTVVSDFPIIVPAHPFNVLPCLAPEPVMLGSLICPYPYTMHCFSMFCPYRTDSNDTELRLMAHPHVTYCMCMCLSTSPSALSASALPITHMEAITGLSSRSPQTYLLCFTCVSSIFSSLLLPIDTTFQLAPYGLTHYCSLLVPHFSSPLIGSLLFLF